MKVNPKKRTESIFAFWFWLKRREGVQHRGELTVPSEILYLPCGCRRRFRSDPGFRLFFEGPGEQWVHYCKDNNWSRGKGTPMVQSSKSPPVDIRKGSLRLVNFVNYFMDGM